MPTVIAHDLAQATAAARAATTAGKALTIRSAPGVGRSLGVAGWRALEAATAAAAPEADLAFCLDCGDEAGDAHAALAFGAARIALAPCAAYHRIADIAAAQGAEIDAGAPDLDLAFIHDPQAAVERLLASN